MIHRADSSIVVLNLHVNKKGYSSSNVQLQDLGAIAEYTKKLKERLIYANVDSYCHVSDSFNIFLLASIYIDSCSVVTHSGLNSSINTCTKAFQFCMETFIMRINLSCMN